MQVENEATGTVAVTPVLPGASTGKLPVGPTAKMAVLLVKIAARLGGILQILSLSASEHLSVAPATCKCKLGDLVRGDSE